MTNDEAIKILKNPPMAYNEQMYEALEIATKALIILGESGIVNCCGCIHWVSDGGALMICDLWDIPMDDFDYCSYGDRGEL